ncbi:hypothetical protein MLD38_030150 [Melastoma candidum]|uniref:Uncharacterized protein n=1 Tax=Melastoma candidum TaxID=119954 RepID=A0ACB9MKM0_9MYRT|nr:hypothetical protein MLD38_030150 [Melastoma candidum]
MSAAVYCGSKRSSSRFEEDLSASKKACRRSPASPARLSPPRLAAKAAVLAQMSARFPHMDDQVLEKVLEECGNDIDAATRRLRELSVGSAEVDGNSKKDDTARPEEGTGAVSGEIPYATATPVEGADWVELLVKEMSSASNFDDARARATRVLEALEQSICQRAHSEAAQNVEKENVMLKQHIEALVRDNAILKRAVAIQHERQKDFEGVSRELQHLKQLIPGYIEQLKKLEMDNYSLSLQLKHTQLCHSFPRNFPPDVC